MSNDDENVFVNLDEDEVEEVVVKPSKVAKKPKKKITDEERDRLRTLLVKARAAKLKKKKPTKPVKSKKHTTPVTSEEEDEEEEEVEEVKKKSSKKKTSELESRLEKLLEKLEKKREAPLTNSVPIYDRYKASETQMKNNILKLF